MECKCDTIGRVLGDGCQHCNPDLAKQIEADNFEDFIGDAFNMADSLINSRIEMSKDVSVCLECGKSELKMVYIDHGSKCALGKAESVISYILEYHEDKIQR